MKKILVLCTGNSCRSQMAEGWLRHFVDNKAEVFSAGLETHGVNPKAIEVMGEAQIDITDHTSDNLEKYTNTKFDYIMTVCDNANENCPYFPGEAQRLHYNFPDPAKASGSEREVMNEFRIVRDLIRHYCEDFVKSNLN